MNHGAKRGHIVLKARARLRWQKVRDMSIAGATREEAAEAVGMTLCGLRTLLIRRVGSSAWPIKL